MSKKVIRDVFINLLAASLCTVVLNFIVYPIYARNFSAEDYGNILTLLGVVNLLWAVLGNCLNNTRLVLNKKDGMENDNGNYNPLIAIGSVVGGIIIILVALFFSITTWLSLILVFFTVIVGIARAYYVVSYRLKLDYVTQLKTNMIVSAGYIIGILMTKSIQVWPLSLLLGEGIAFFYTIKKGTLFNEPFCFTDDKRVVIHTYTDLIVTGLIGNLITYFDRFLINPLLGAVSVSVFSVASFWGKAVTPFISPTANVMLSYLSQKDSKISMKKFITIFMASVVPLIAFGIVGIWLAPWITGLLYPTLIDKASPYIFMASMGGLVQSSTNLLMPVLLSVCSSRSILIMQMMYFAVYLVIAFLGAKVNGLRGFCVATCIIGVIKIGIFFVFGYFAMKRKETI